MKASWLVRRDAPDRGDDRARLDAKLGRRVAVAGQYVARDLDANAEVLRVAQRAHRFGQVRVAVVVDAGGSEVLGRDQAERI